MSSVLIIILTIVSNLLPANVNQCTVTIAEDELSFTRQNQNWRIVQVHRTEDNSIKKEFIGEYRVDGLDIYNKHNDHEHKVPTNNLLGITNAKDLKALKLFTFGQDTLDLLHDDNSISIKKDGKALVKVKWDKPKQ